MSEMKIVCYCCDSSAIAVRRALGSDADGVETRQVPCTGTVDVLDLLRDIRSGADAVMVAGCLEGNCQHNSGSVRARRRVEQARSVLRSLGMDEGRVEMYNIAPNQVWRFIEALAEIRSRIATMGMNPLRRDQDDNS